MSENTRQTQFAGFANLLWEDIRNRLEFWVDTCEDDFTEQVKNIMAQRAYDFLVSSHYHTAMLASWEESKKRVALVPDMTQWPPEQGDE